MILERRRLFERDCQRRTISNLDRCGRDQRQRVRLIELAADRPAFVRLWCEDDFRLEARSLFVIGECRRERHAANAAECELSRRLRRLDLIFAEDWLVLVVEHEDSEVPHSLFGRAVRAAPQHDAINRLFGFQIDLPPRVVFLSGVRDRVLRVLAVGVVIVRSLRVAAEVSCALLGVTLECEVVVAGKNLHLGEMQEPSLARKFDSHKPAVESRPIRRSDRGRDLRQHKVSATEPRPFAGECVIRQRVETQCGEVAELARVRAIALRISRVCPNSGEFSDLQRHLD